MANLPSEVLIFFRKLPYRPQLSAVRQATGRVGVNCVKYCSWLLEMYHCCCCCCWDGLRFFIPLGMGFGATRLLTCQDGPSAGLLGARDRLQKYRAEHPKIFGEVENLLTEEWGGKMGKVGFDADFLGAPRTKRKWLTMVIVGRAPKDRVVKDPFQKAFSWLINDRY